VWELLRKYTHVYWRTPSYNVTRLLIAVFMAFMYGCVYYMSAAYEASALRLATVQNVMGARRLLPVVHQRPPPRPAPPRLRLHSLAAPAARGGGRSSAAEVAALGPIALVAAGGGRCVQALCLVLPTTLA
jgi:hypothetical protein